MLASWSLMSHCRVPNPPMPALRMSPINSWSAPVVSWGNVPTLSSWSVRIMVVGTSFAGTVASTLRRRSTRVGL